MAKRPSYTWPVFTAVVAVLVLLIATPRSWKGWAPGFIQTPALHLGLDLAGGTQLDFRISEEEIRQQLADLQKQLSQKEKENGTADELNQLRAQIQSVQEQQSNLVEAIRMVLERRINALGVSEATITPSYIGNEKHLLVECPGVVDVQECIKVVGKTIQLEFKEQFTEVTDDFKNEVRARADATMRRITTSGSSLKKEGQDTGTQLGMAYSDAHTYFRDELPTGLEAMWTRQPGQIYKLDGSVTVPQQDDKGQVTEETVPGIFITEVVRPLTATGRTVNEAPKAFALLAKTETGATYAEHDDTSLTDTVDSRIAAALRVMRGGELKTVSLGDTQADVLFLRGFQAGAEQISASHILVSYKGASNAEPTVTRTKEQALERAKAIKTQLDGGSDFAGLARRESDGPSKTDGGNLGSFGRGVMAPSFEQAAFALKQGQVSEPIETQFGYHVIKLDKAVSKSPDVAAYDQLSIKGTGAQSRADLIVKRLQSGDVRTTEQAVALRTLFFSLLPSGWKDTELDGKHFQRAAVSLDPVTGVPVVQITFDAEGGKLFQELTRTNINKPIAIFVGGELVSAPRVQAEISGGSAVITGSRTVEEAQTLAQDLNTGAIPAPIHLAGQYTVEATLGSAALQTSLMAALIGILVLMVYMIVVYRMLGVVADIALVVYSVILFAILKLPLLLFTSDYIVLTLAGMAGIILSIGMAVDANVLVFERMKEELRKGKTFKTAIDSSFKHAWPAIRDGNISTLITCGILFIVGTSIVRGFAITLGMGVPISMFSAIVVTRWLLKKLAATPLAENPALFGASASGK